MARQKNDGRGRMGGRQKGTPNKVTTDLKSWLTQIVDQNRTQIEQDIQSLLPDERVRVISGLLNYIIPKQQALSVEAQVETEYSKLRELLESAPDEAVDRIAERVLFFMEQNKQRPLNECHTTNN